MSFTKFISALLILSADIARAGDRFGITESSDGRGSKIEELVIAGAFCGAALGVLVYVWSMILGKKDAAFSGYVGLGAIAGAVPLPIAYFLLR